jgi:putative sigma-54 modulation protein
MNITVTGRHVTVTPAIEEYARKKIEGIHIDFPRILDAHFILEVEKFRQRAEVVLHCGNHIHIEASDVHEDLYAAIDNAVDKAERQLRKHKTRIQDHHQREARRGKDDLGLSESTPA